MKTILRFLVFAITSVALAQNPTSRPHFDDFPVTETLEPRLRRSEADDPSPERIFRTNQRQGS